MSKATDAWNAYKLTDEDRNKILKLGGDARIGEHQLILLGADTPAQQLSSAVHISLCQL